MQAVLLLQARNFHLTTGADTINLVSFTNHLLPLFKRLGIKEHDITPAWSYELTIGEHTLHLIIEEHGRLLMTLNVETPIEQGNSELAWRLLNMNSFSQPAPAIHLSATPDRNVILWCNQQLQSLNPEQLALLPDRFLAQVIHIKELKAQFTGKHNDSSPDLGKPQPSVSAQRLSLLTRQK